MTPVQRIVDRVSLAMFLGGIAGVLIGLLWGSEMLWKISGTAALIGIAAGAFNTVVLSLNK